MANDSAFQHDNLGTRINTDSSSNATSKPIAGGLDFGTAVYDEETGKQCILKMEEMNNGHGVESAHTPLTAEVAWQSFNKELTLSTQAHPPVPLHLRDKVCTIPAGGLRGDLPQAVPHSHGAAG